MDRAVLGKAGERAAAKYLRRRGYRILKHNYRCQLGEIDLIALDVETLVFAEVKARTVSTDAEPLIDLRRDQRSRIMNAAQCFLLEAGATGWPSRFDVLGLSWGKGRRWSIQHFVDAFQPKVSDRARSGLWA